MDTQRKAKRTSKNYKRSEINLVSARSALNDDIGSYSRSARSSGYTKQRSKRTRNRRVIIGVLVTLLAILVAGASSAFGLMLYLNNQLTIDQQGHRLNTEALSRVTVDRAKPDDPFWMLLVGTDWSEDGGEVLRSDVMILVHVDPGHKKAALVSIPRDTMVRLEGYGTNKINAAFAYGEMERLGGDENASGAVSAIKAVNALTGADIAAYAQVGFDGLIGVVDAMGGVEVEVPLDIIGDRQAGPVDVYAGLQVLDGQQALVFCRSRQYVIGDFQRQANQRTLLQAIAKQVLSQDIGTIANTVGKVAEMTTTNLSVADIIAIAGNLRGMTEADIYTYSLPSGLDNIDGISYVVVDEYETRALIASINAGEYPDYSEQTYQGEVSDRYRPQDRSAPAVNQAAAASLVDTTQYAVSVRNGYGIAHAASAVSDLLMLAGYQQLEIGNANSMVYKETLIVYREDTDKEAADDIRARLGYGRVIPSYGRYAFEGNILVVVGGDFPS